MRPFSPIAIVGRACLLPGVASPADLWQGFASGTDFVGGVAPGRWRLAPELALGSPGGEPDRAFSDRGGRVEGFAERFDASGFALPAAEILALDPLVQWTLHVGREALRDAGLEGQLDRAGAVLGNLSLPSEGLAAWTEATWLAGQDLPPGVDVPQAHPANRFMSGLPAHLLATALELGGGAFALDAACASALYAVKLACDRLQDGEADVMLAGAVNRADNLFLHVGFSTLQALSPSGQSRPFHQGADGLLPAEGAAFVVLKRLDDAVAAGDRIHGVIRGVGLSNDGRAAGMLSPAEEGQARAMREAFARAGWQPSDVSLVECHATGTALGDATELASLASVYAGVQDLPLGSAKSNFGHTITVAGLVGLLKVLGAMEAGVRPPSLHVEDPLPTPFRILSAPEPWPADRPRRAAVSAFGFGGNNAHLLVEAYDGQAGAPPAPPSQDPVAIVGVAVRAADLPDTAAFTRALFGGEVHLRASEVRLQVSKPRVPPNDLAQTLPQQLWVLEAAAEALAGLAPLPRERTSVLVGMQTDAEVARHGLRWRLAQARADAGWLAAAQDAACAPLQPARVIGTLPNAVTNRLNGHFDLAGPSCSISAEEHSGLVALDLAARALRAGEVDAAIVGAVDLACEASHAAAVAALYETGHAPGDGAAVLVLKRLADAQRDGYPVYAVLGDARAACQLTDLDLGAQFGHAHAAEGLLHVAAAALALHHRALPQGPGREAAPWLGSREPRAARVRLEALGAGHRELVLAEAPDARPAPLALEPRPRLHVYAAPTRQEAIAAARAGHEGLQGRARLVIVASSPAQLERRREQALALLAAGAPGPVLAAGCYFQPEPVEGELAFVFAASAGAYAGMGRRLALACPQLGMAIERRFGRLREAVGWAFDPADPAPGLMDKLWGTAWLAQLHAGFSLEALGLRPAAVIGLSAGETNALLAMGAWPEVEALYDDLHASEVFTRHLGGACEVFEAQAGPGARWANWRVVAPEAQVEAAIAPEPSVRITIIHADGDYTIGGEAEACARVARALGLDRAQHLGYDVTVHCPELEPYAARWKQLHDRETVPVPGVRFYAHAVGGVYELEREAVAEALTEHVRRPIDFRTIVERAYADGVRIFVEHGPQGGCTAWVRRILGDRPHLALALDQAGEPSLDHQANAAAQLLAAGVPLRDLAPFGLDAPELPPGLAFPAHQAPVQLPTWKPMAPAPALPPVVTTATVPQPAATAPAQPARVQAPGLAASPRLASYATHLASGHQSHQDYLTHLAQSQAQYLEATTRAFAGAAGFNMAPVAAPPIPVAPIPAAPPMAPPPPPAPTPKTTGPKGPTYTRADLEVLASGRIADVWGPAFANQAGYARQVRMPRPPLLLADRVTGIDAPQGQLATGTIWTETDVPQQAWYLHAGRMPAGIMIESGQADLLLISWMGIDALNRGERVYRLLGCELTYHAGPDGVLPAPGETLAFDIHVDGHAQHGDVRLFFFHYDCRIAGQPRLTVRKGQAGFFTDAELDDSGGIIWDAADAAPIETARHARPRVQPTRTQFGLAAVQALAEGRAAECFGPGFELAWTHQRTPGIPAGRTQLFDQVTHLDPQGGPWGRGYLRATAAVTPDHWYFDGHFQGDPCMPGTLMFDGCLQTMAFYLAGLGFTLDHDGWRFEPVPDQPYQLSCRGQVTPTSRELQYEVFVQELVEGDMPTLFADLLVTVDGLKAFHCRAMGLRLVPDWPVTSRPEVAQAARETDAALGLPPSGFGYASMLACAWGRPSDAFGPDFAVFDGVRRLPRLPGPPYHFMSRIDTIHEPAGPDKVGTRIVAAYDVPPDAWYFAAGGTGTMPYAVLLEAALQPCGWLAMYIGTPLQDEQRLFFRNLDGTATLEAEIPPGAGTLITEVTLTSLSRSAGMVIVAFKVACSLGGQRIYSMDTVFGFFPGAALAAQKGLPATPEASAWLASPSDARTQLRGEPNPGPRLAKGDFLMLDEVTGFWPTGGSHGLGKVRAEMQVDPNAWFFKAHFFQDPVQPGSLGIEAMIQALQWYMREAGLAEGVPAPRFQPIATGRPLSWKYRGQVLPHNRRVYTELDVVAVGQDEAGPFAVADGSLWVDGMRIYEAKGLAMRVLPGDQVLVDPQDEPWLLDHRPTYTTPALPMMAIADMLAAAALRHRPGRPLLGLDDLHVTRWVTLPAELRFRLVEAQEDALVMALDVWRDAENPAMSRFEQAATARVRFGSQPPPSPWEPLDGAIPQPNPYEAGQLFHGPAFQVLRTLAMGPNGSTAVLDAGTPRGVLHPVLLDGITHAVPNDNLTAWNPAIPADRVGYPSRIKELRVFGPMPATGDVRCEVRFAGGERFEAQLIHGDTVWATLQLELVLVPKGPLGMAPPADRQAFLRGRQAVPGVGLSSRDGTTTRLSRLDVLASDWLPGTVAAIYGSADPAHIAIKDHVAALAGVHPSQVRVQDEATATVAGRPYAYELKATAEGFTVRS